MLTFRMDESNFDQGTRDGLRIVEGLGLKGDFDEFAPDADTLGLWHLHDGACAGEGNGLEDASGGGHDLANSGADSVEDGYRFDAADPDHMDAGAWAMPGHVVLTVECWARGLVESPADEKACLWTWGRDADNWVRLVARRRAGGGTSSRLRAGLTGGGVSPPDAVWEGEEVTALLESDQPWHAAVVLDGTDLVLYVNGEAKASTGAQTLAAGDYNLTLGAFRTGGPYFWNLTGRLDEVRLSSAARYTAGFTPYRLLGSGTLASPTFDAIRLAADWTDLIHVSDVPDGCGVAWEARAADDTDAGGHPQALWQSYGGDPQTLPDGRYFQWRATLTASADRLLSPTVESVEAIASEAGYDLYRATGDGPAALDYADPWLRVGPSVAEAETGALAAGAVHWFGIRPVDADGRQCPVTQNEVRLELDADGEPVPSRPAAPLAMGAASLPAGRVRLWWHYRIGHTGATPEAFRIYGDGGTGTVDYETPLGEVTFQSGQTGYAWTSGALAPDIEHQLAVRAVAGDDVWDETPAVVRVTPDASPPGTVDALSAETTQ